MIQAISNRDIDLVNLEFLVLAQGGLSSQSTQLDVSYVVFTKLTKMGLQT